MRGTYRGMALRWHGVSVVASQLEGWLSESLPCPVREEVSCFVGFPLAVPLTSLSPTTNRPLYLTRSVRLPCNGAEARISFVPFRRKVLAW